MKKIIIDCDPGHDDAIAIMLAYANKEKLQLEAITTVCGNNVIEKITRNAGLVTAICHEQTPIFVGSEKPLIGMPIIIDKYHGVTGMDGPTDLPEADTPRTDKNAVEAIRDILRESDEKVFIVALAPLTNLALLLRTYPELAANIEAISLMGGGADHGNITPFAEFNIYADPEAAQIVFSSGIPIIMSGLDVTEQALLQRHEFEHLRTKGEAGRFFCELMDFYSVSSGFFGVSGCMLHDPCAVAWLIAPEIFSGKQADVRIELSGRKTGKTAVTRNEHGSTLFLDSVDREAFRDMIITSMEKLDAQLKVQHKGGQASER